MCRFCMHAYMLCAHVQVSRSQKEEERREWSHDRPTQKTATTPQRLVSQLIVKHNQDTAQRLRVRHETTQPKNETIL